MHMGMEIIHVCTYMYIQLLVTLCVEWKQKFRENQEYSTTNQIRLGKIQGFFWDLKEIQGHVVDFLRNSRTFTYMYV